MNYRNDDFICISAKHKHNIDTLIQALLHECITAISQDDIILTNARHYEALQRAHDAIELVLQGIDSNIARFVEFRTSPSSSLYW